MDGSEVLAQDGNDRARAEFNTKSLKEFSTIALAVSTPQFYLITSLDKLKDTRDALRCHFERDTLANRLFLKKQYFKTEMKEGTSMEGKSEVHEGNHGA